MEPAKKLSPAITALIVIVLIGVVAAAVAVIINNSNQQTSTNSTTTQESQANTPTTSSTAAYKNGTYTQTGSYVTPGGSESVGVTVTLVDDVITTTTMTQNGVTGEAKEYQGDFAAGYKSLVVGKNIDEVSLSRVAGSSLTSNGFNSALDLIKTDARA